VAQCGYGDVFLGCSLVLQHVPPLSKLQSLELIHKPMGEWAAQAGGGEGAQISRLPGGFPVFHV